jgi:glycine oxidase
MSNASTVPGPLCAAQGKGPEHAEQPGPLCAAQGKGLEHADVLILGGGVIGLTTAYYLARAGSSVTVVDRRAFGQEASWAGAGIIPAANPETADTPFERFRALSVGLYPSLSQELREETGLDNGYVVCGGLELLDGVEENDEEWRSAGVGFREVAGDELHRLVPDLAPDIQRACYLPTMAQVRNPWHLKALIEACKRRGVRLVPDCEARRIIRTGDRIDAVDIDQGTMTAGRYLVAGGAWSEGLLQQVGWRPGIRPIRGQMALFQTGRQGVRPVLLAGRRYLVPRTDGRLLAGSTEEDVGFQATPTGGGIGELIAFALTILPGLAETPLEKCWAGLRPGSPDGLPFLGLVPGCRNLFVAAGHFRAGILLSPATGLVMSQLLRDEAPAVPLDPFRPERA